MAEEGSSASDVCEVRSLSRFVAGFLKLEIKVVRPECVGYGSTQELDFISGLLNTA